MMSRAFSAARAVARSGAVSRLQHRCFAAGFLDKAEVSERVQNVVRGFSKVNAAKVSPTAHFTNDLGACLWDGLQV
jgi:hypothetical protein